MDLVKRESVFYINYMECKVASKVLAREHNSTSFILTIWNVKEKGTIEKEALKKVLY